GNACITEDHLSQKEQMEEEMFLGLRKKSGVSMARFEEKFGQSFAGLYGEIVRDLGQQGLMQIEGDHVRMTKRGLFLGDTVAERFILE
ncbi:oxygen-independent coproporphyrinogen III oxidase, partial [Burkholderia contaminans]|nr:oxygen-independent coproporphyrinogen III oxidase [Burkholderia contaminans]